MRHLQKLESIGQLTGGVAHDFNNLLTAVMGNLELLRKRVPPNPSTDRLIDGALQGAQRGASLTQRLLAFARRQSLEPRPVDMAELVHGMDELLRRSIGHSVQMTVDLPPDVPAAQADANQIELALLNLAVNARDAMPDGGTLTIALDCASTGDAQDLAAGRYVRLVVSDTGAGMDGDTLRRAIEPFFSTKEVGKGTGLGLSMIHGLALQLKGALRLFSEPGRGTRAELWLPIADGPTTAASVEQPVAQRGTPRRATLLFVDDDFLISLSTAMLLEDLGHTVIKATSGPDALSVLQNGKPIDLLITDYAMPGMTGLQLAEEARRLRPELPILLATGYADLPTQSELSCRGCRSPTSRRQLAEQIATLLGYRPQREQRAQGRISQPQSAPHQQAEIDAEQRVAEQRIAEAQMAGDRAAKQAGQQDRTQSGGARPGVERRADQHDDAQQTGEGVGGRVTQLLQAVGDGLDRHHLDGAVHQQEQDDQAAHHAAGPEQGRRVHGSALLLGFRPSTRRRRTDRAAGRSVAPEHQLHRQRDLGAGIDRTLKRGVDPVDLQMQHEGLRVLERAAMLREGIAQHHRTAIDHQMQVDQAALRIGRRARHFLRAERLGVEFRCRSGIGDKEIGCDAAQNGLADGCDRSCRFSSSCDHAPRTNATGAPQSDQIMI